MGNVKATAQDIVMEQGRLHLKVAVTSHASPLPHTAKLFLGDGFSEVPLVLSSSSSSLYGLPFGAGAKVAQAEGEGLVQLSLGGELVPLESEEPLRLRFLDGDFLVRFATDVQGRLCYRFEKLSAQKSSPYSVVRLDKLTVEGQRLHIAGRFAPLGMVIQEWGQASYVLVLQSAERVYSFGLGLLDRLDAALPVTLRKAYFADLQGQGVDLGRVQDGVYSLSIVVANQDISVSSGVLGTVTVASPSGRELPRISLLGSCIIRDVFNSRFVPDWKNRSQLVSEAFQQSIVSVVSPEYAGPQLDLSDLDTLARRYTEADLQKTFLKDTVAQSPEWVLIDLFSDARFAAIEVEPNRFITDNSWKIANSASYRSLSGMRRYKFSENPGEYLGLFRQSLQILKGALPEGIKFVLVKTDAAPCTRNDAGQVDEKLQIAEELNEAFRALEEVLFDEIPECKVLDVRNYALWGDKEHPWSSYVVHYEQSFYDALDEKIRALVGFSRTVSVQIPEK